MCFQHSIASLDSAGLCCRIWRPNPSLLPALQWELGDFIISDNLAVGHEASPQAQLPPEKVRCLLTQWGRPVAGGGASLVCASGADASGSVRHYRPAHS
jgi:hypothetical protein